MQYDCTDWDCITTYHVYISVKHASGDTLCKYCIVQKQLIESVLIYLDYILIKNDFLNYLWAVVVIIAVALIGFVHWLNKNHWFPTEKAQKSKPDYQTPTMHFSMPVPPAAIGQSDKFNLWNEQAVNSS